MTITITEKEYNAIHFAINQIECEIEAGSDESFLENANEELRGLYSVVEKYKKARIKANEFQQVRAYVSEKNRNRHLLARDIDRMARKVLRKIKEKED